VTEGYRQGRPDPGPDGGCDLYRITD
jgi:hypothetical protein